MSDWRPSASAAVLRRQAEFKRTVREFFHARGVLEVQTPLLGEGTVTDPDVEGISVPGHGYLQTSPEYFLKRLLAAGLPSCYQMGAAFRKDERGRQHNQEFTLLEWYRVDFDHIELMAEVSELVNSLLGTTEYETVRYASLVGDVRAPRDQLDLEFADACTKLKGRTYVIDYPADQAALARLNPSNEEFAARFELVIDGVEIANGYWELLDAQQHRHRFEQDNVIRAERGLKPKPVDEAFLAAIEQGLPACAGVAVGMDRLLMAALGERDIEAVIAFRD